MARTGHGRRNLVGKARGLFGTSTTDQKSNLLGVWPKWGPWLIVSVSTIDSNPATWGLLSGLSPCTPGIADPDGGNNACHLNETAVGATHRLQRNAVCAMGPGSTTIALKAAERTQAKWRWEGGSGIADLVTGASSGVTPGWTLTSVPLTGGWFDWTLNNPSSNPGSQGLYLSVMSAGVESYVGVVGWGIYAYNARFAQTSIVTAPNLHASIALRDFLDRLDLTNPTKISEPIDRLTDWNGRECAGYYGANWLGCDAAAVVVSGTDRPLCVAIGFWPTANAGDWVTLANIGAPPAAPDTPNRRLLMSAGPAVGFSHRDDAFATKSSTAALSFARHSLVMSSTGTVMQADADRAALVLGATDDDVGQTTLDTATFGAMRRDTGTLAYASGTERLGIIGRAAPSSVRYLDNLIAAYAGGIA